LSTPPVFMGQFVRVKTPPFFGGQVVGAGLHKRRSQWYAAETVTLGKIFLLDPRFSSRQRPRRRLQRLQPDCFVEPRGTCVPLRFLSAKNCFLIFIHSVGKIYQPLVIFF
jgi:hypothetical protein